MTDLLRSLLVSESRLSSFESQWAQPKEVFQMSDTKKSQIERFQEAARKLGCDEDEAAFDAKLAAIARQRPKAETTKDE